MSGKEQRREPRYQTQASAEVKYRGTTLNVQVVEISRHGCRMVCPKLIQPGAMIDIVLFLKNPERVTGEVKWAFAEPISARGTISYQMGVALKEAVTIPNGVT